MAGGSLVGVVIVLGEVVRPRCVELGSPAPRQFAPCSAPSGTVGAKG